LYTRWSWNWICNAAGGVSLAAGEAGAGSVLDNGAATVPAVVFAIPGDGFAVAVGVVLVVGRTISWRAIGASLDTVFGGGVIRDGLVVCLCCVLLFGKNSFSWRNDDEEVEI